MIFLDILYRFLLFPPKFETKHISALKFRSFRVGIFNIWKKRKKWKKIEKNVTRPKCNVPPHSGGEFWREGLTCSIRPSVRVRFEVNRGVDYEGSVRGPWPKALSTISISFDTCVVTSRCTHVSVKQWQHWPVNKLYKRSSYFARLVQWLENVLLGTCFDKSLSLIRGIILGHQMVYSSCDWIFVDLIRHIYSYLIPIKTNKQARISETIDWNKDTILGYYFSDKHTFHRINAVFRISALNAIAKNRANKIAIFADYSTCAAEFLFSHGYFCFPFFPCVPFCFLLLKNFLCG